MKIIINILSFKNSDKLLEKFNNLEKKIEYESKNNNLTLSLNKERNNITQEQIKSNKLNLKNNNRMQFAYYLKKTFQLFPIIINQTVNITKQLNPIAYSRNYNICKLDIKIFSNMKKFQKTLSLKSLNSRAAVNNMIIFYNQVSFIYLLI